MYRFLAFSNEIQSFEVSTSVYNKRGTTNKTDGIGIGEPQKRSNHLHIFWKSEPRKQTKQQTNTDGRHHSAFLFLKIAFPLNFVCSLPMSLNVETYDIAHQMLQEADCISEHVRTQHGMDNNS